MGGTIAVVVIRVVEAVFSPEEETQGNEDGRKAQQNGFDIHLIYRFEKRLILLILQIREGTQGEP